MAIDKCFKGVKSAKDVSVSHFSASLTKQRIGNATNMKKNILFWLNLHYKQENF